MSVKPRAAIARKSECLVRSAELEFEVSNGGIVPRRLLVKLLMDCMGCIVLVRFEVELFMTDQMNENLFCSRQRKNDDVVTFSLACGNKFFPEDSYHGVMAIWPSTRSLKS
jgi:hypothetical protein